MTDHTLPTIPPLRTPKDVARAVVTILNSGAFPEQKRIALYGLQLALAAINRSDHAKTDE
jgi:hypothetical protein